jgi:hypothetical protein
VAIETQLRPGLSAANSAPLPPLIDGWGHRFRFRMGEGHYSIWSPGSDGVFAGQIVEGPTTAFDCDLVYSDGTFITYPEGI